jgi:hypothetical protein
MVFQQSLQKLRELQVPLDTKILSPYETPEYEKA